MTGGAVRIAGADWARIEAQLDEEGFAILPGLMDQPQVRDLADLREALYPRLVAIADRWNETLGSPVRPPARRSGEAPTRSTSTVLRQGDYQPLHQSAGAEQGFAFQLTALLSEPGRDFTGGEFVMVEQRPRMQSRPMVVPLKKGDVAIIASAQRPHRGSKGYYRVKVKHAISRVRSGERVGMELLFHAPA